MAAVIDIRFACPAVVATLPCAVIRPSCVHGPLSLRFFSLLFIIFQNVNQGGKFVEIRRLPSLIGHKPKIVRFAFSPDSTRLLTLDNDEVAKVWEMNDWANQQTPRELFQFSNPFGLPSLMAISPDNLTVAMAHLNRLTTFALADSTVTDSIDSVFASSIHQLVFSPDSEFVVVTGDKCVRLLHHLTGWRARLRDCEKRLQLASSETHQNGLREEIAMTKSRISLLT